MSSLSIAKQNQTEFSVWMPAMQTRVETALNQRLPVSEQQPQRLHAAMRYATLNGGKRIRALLVYAAGAIANAPIERLDQIACAVEFIHAYSLVHDDLPCMDNDILRRGKPTVHIAFDEATALLAGDALQSLAFQVISNVPVADTADKQLAMVALLAEASGSLGMAGGQAIDLNAIGSALTLEELEIMHHHKTGALIRAAILLGAQAGTPLSSTILVQLEKFAKTVGLLFQVIDDILDAEADTVILGKTAGKDAHNNKPTYISLLGAEKARQFATDLLNEAYNALAPLGDHALPLKALAGYIVQRPF